MLAAGSRYETAETNGIAHFAEHMFFKGTERRPTARDIAGEIDAHRRRVQRLHRQGVHGLLRQVRRRDRDVALDVLVDMLRHSKFDAEEIEREKGVIVEEMNMYFDTPRDFIGGVYEELLYGDQPLGWDIDRPQGDGARGHARDVPRLHRPLVPAGAAWSSASAARSATTCPSGSRSCSATSSRATPAAPAAAAAPSRERRARAASTTKASDQAHLVPRRAAACRSAHPDRYALQLLATVLGGGMSSRLFTEVRERRGLAYYVFGVNHSYTDAGSLYSQAGVDIDARSTRRSTTIVARAAQDRRRAGAGRRAREGAQLRQGPLRAPAREPAGDDHVRPAARGARGRGRPSRRTCSPASTRVTAEDVQRVAQDADRRERAATSR